MARAAKEITAPPDSAENPLVPHRVLRQIYSFMLGLRRLERSLADAGQMPENAAGYEACLASLAASLRKGDLLSEGGGGITLALLQQTSPSQIRRQARDVGYADGVVELPTMAVATERLLMAVGAAVTAKASKKGQVLIVLVDAGEVSLPLWRQMLGFVSRLELPMLFVVLPAKRTAGQGRLSAQSAGWGVPGFPVDGSDALAMYRVVQESMGRLRTGGGPVLIECLAWHVAGSRRVDPVARMRDLLLNRGISTAAMLEREEQV